MQLTSHQHQLLTLLRQSRQSQTAYALLDQLRASGMRAPTQVYRALDKLIALGLVHRLESLNAYVACTQAHSCRPGQAAFAICDDCGGVEELDGAAMGRALERWARNTRFALRSAAIELQGRCAACAGTS